MNANHPNQRSIKNVLINKPLQREFTIVMILIMMTAGLMVAFTINQSLLNMVQEVPHSITTSKLEAMVLDVRLDLVVKSLVIIFLAVMVTGFLGVLFLHRVAGPVFRFGMILKKIAAGQVPELM